MTRLKVSHYVDALGIRRKRVTPEPDEKHQATPAKKKPPTAATRKTTPKEAK